MATNKIPNPSVFYNNDDPEPSRDYGLDREREPEPEPECAFGLNPPSVAMKPGPRVSVPCSKEGCGHVTVFPLGDNVLTKHLTCPHVFTFDVTCGLHGAFVCKCGIFIPAHIVEKALDPRRRYDKDQNAIADIAGRLADEKRELLAENAELRRELERLKRKVTR